MTKREVIQAVVQHRKPPYVPWSFGFTKEAEEKLKMHFPDFNGMVTCGNHLLGLGHSIFDEVGNDRWRDAFGVVWNRSVDKDIGIVEGQVLPEPSLKGYALPSPLNPRFYKDISETIARYSDRYRVYSISFSLYERAWTMRGMTSLMMDFYDHPEFVRDLLRQIADHNIARVHQALRYDIDGIYFGDDWGQQHGLQMSPATWREFIYPELKRMYGAVKEAGKAVFIHSCGDVDELFDDLVAAGLDCFNPFQPEVMDVAALIAKYRGRLCFHGGLSTQRILPYGSAEDVRRETRRLMELGREGGYILSPAHSVEGDVPLENMLAMIETVQSQAMPK